VSEVLLFCSGKGSHDRRYFGPIVDQRDGNALVETLAPHADFGRPDTDHRRARRRTSKAGFEVISTSRSIRIVTNRKGERTFHVGPCPLCSRSPRVPEAAMVRLIDAAMDDTPTAATLLDVSHWPW
jgi:hypothetical protein